MIEKGLTVRKAAELWVNGFNAIQSGMIKKLMMADMDDWHERTLPSLSDHVYVYSLPDGCGSLTQCGNIVGYDEEKDLYIIRMNDGVEVDLDQDDFEVERDTLLPMWNTMWSFNNCFDEDWLDRSGGIRLMSQCGFRVYESDEFGWFFGVDGAGYSFLDQHWVPLYLARGLHWHDPSTEQPSEEQEKRVV